MTGAVTPVAVVGIDCRFPGAADKESYWRLLLDASVTDTEVPAHRWDVDSAYHPDGVVGTMNTRRAHFIDDVDAFDNDFFGIAPIEAAGLDPQQRLLLQASWRALEDAGIDPRSLAGTDTGVFVGMMSSEWGSLQMMDYARLTPFRGAGSGYFMAANRISYHLNLTGPSMAIDSACSSSLMAIHQACAALRSGESDTVIAGGANLILTPALSIFYTQAGLSASDGRCKPFGVGADGIGRGEGVAAVVLRRLDDALADGQPIYAVVRGSVANQDGRSNGITAPSRKSQVELMRKALRQADAEAGDLAFVEAHGTGTVLGDMIETNALGDIHKVRAQDPCLLGSVKGNIGHTEGSAGIAAFIKACLALHHGVLPPTVFGGEANPGLRLDAQGLRLAETAQKLPEGALGGVSSFGLGGSNAHVVLAAAPVVIAVHEGNAGIVSLSAPSDSALRRNVEAMASALERVPTDRVAGWSRTTNVVKGSHRYRVAVGGDRDALLAGLRGYLSGERPELGSDAPARRAPARVGLLCTGQGAQYVGMTRPLYETNARYRGHLDTVIEALDAHVNEPLLPAVFGELAVLDHTSIAQPALFAVSYALGKTLLDTGLKPTFGIGHSVGEIALAALADVLTLPDAAALIAVRGRLMGALPQGGAMAAIDASAAEIEPMLPAGAAIAAINGPESVVVSGAADAVECLADKVRGNGGRISMLTVSHAFHSPLMEPVVAEFRSALATLEPGPASFPIFSTVTGAEIAGTDLDAEHWVRQLCAPVRFLDAAQAAATVAADYVAEAGPRPTLLRLIRRCGLPQTVRSLSLCSGPDSDGTELISAASTVVRDGHPLDLDAVYGAPIAGLHRIPPYEFDAGNRYWFDLPALRPSAEPAPSEGAAGNAQELPPGPGGAVLALIADVGGYAVSELTRASLLSDDLGYDSLLQLRLIDRLRAQYPHLESVDVAEVVPNIHTVGDLVDFVTTRLEPDTAGAAR